MPALNATESVHKTIYENIGPNHSFLLGTQKINEMFGALNSLSGPFESTHPPATTLRSDGTTIQEMGTLYSTNSGAVKTIPNGIICIAKTGGLYGYRYQEETLSLYELTNIDVPRKICSITGRSFSTAALSAITVFGEYLFVAEKALKLANNQEESIAFDNIPDVIGVTVGNKNFIIPGDLVAAGKSFAHNAPQTNTSSLDFSSIGIPLSIGNQESFLFISKGNNTNRYYDYIIAKKNGNALQEIGSISMATFSNPLFSVNNNKLFFVKTCEWFSYKKPEKQKKWPDCQKGILYSFDGIFLQKEGRLYYNFILPQLTFLEGKLTLYNECVMRSAQFSPVYLNMSDSDHKEVVTLLKRTNLCKELGPGKDASSTVHELYKRFSRDWYIWQMIPGFFDGNFDPDTDCSADNMITFLKRVRAKQDIINSHTHREHIKATLKEDLLARYGPLYEVLSSPERRALSDRASSSLRECILEKNLLRSRKMLFIGAAAGTYYTLGAIPAVMFLLTVWGEQKDREQKIRGELKHHIATTERLGTKYIEQLTEQKETLSFLFGSDIQNMIMKNPQALCFSILSRIYRKKKSAPEISRYTTELKKPDSPLDENWLLD